MIQLYARIGSIDALKYLQYFSYLEAIFEINIPSQKVPMKKIITPLFSQHVPVLDWINGSPTLFSAVLPVNYNEFIFVWSIILIPKLIANVDLWKKVRGLKYIKHHPILDAHGCVVSNEFKSQQTTRSSARKSWSQHRNPDNPESYSSGTHHQHSLYFRVHL